MRRFSTAALSAFLMLGMVALVFQNAAAVTISPTVEDLSGTGDDYLGVQYAVDNGPTLVCENSWNSGANASCMTFEEAAADASKLTQTIQTAEFSPGANASGDASNTSLKNVVSGAVTNGKHGWYDSGVNVVEFDFNFANTTNADRLKLHWGSRSGSATHTNSESMYVTINFTDGGPGTTVGFYDGAAQNTANVTGDANTTGTGYLKNGYWYHVTMAYTENATGSHFMWQIGDLVFTWDTVILGFTTSGNWLFLVEYQGAALGGSTTMYTDNLVMYSTSSLDLLSSILAGNLTTDVNEIVDLLLGLLPVIVLVAVVPMIGRSLRGAM